MPRGDDFGPTPQLAMPRLTPAVKWMLIVLGAAFLIVILDDKRGFPTGGRLVGWGALFPVRVLHHFQFWRLFTYPLVNPMAGDITPMLWGGMTLYFFGTDLEELLGSRRFLVFVALCVFLSGIVATLYGLVHPVYFTQPVLGLAPLSLALTAAWGTRFPNKRLFFPPVSGKWLVIGLLAIQIIYIIAKATNESPAASIGAIGIGFLLTRYWDRIDDVLDRMRIRRARAKRDRVLRAIRGGLDDRGGSSKPGGKKPIDKRFLN